MLISAPWPLESSSLDSRPFISGKLSPKLKVQSSKLRSKELSALALALAWRTAGTCTADLAPLARRPDQAGAETTETFGSEDGKPFIHAANQAKPVIYIY